MRPLTAVGALLARLRLDLGIRQYEMASALGVRQSLLSSYERGYLKPTLRFADSVVAAYPQCDAEAVREAVMSDRARFEYPYAVSSPVVDFDLRMAGDSNTGEALRMLHGCYDSLTGEESRLLLELARGFASSRSVDA